ncbi:MAG: hypothetical protein ACR2ML_09905 [Solirubrobacteraceae bacterium]
MRVAAVVGDLLFGSKVKAMLEAAGHEVSLVATPERAGEADVLVVDLASGTIEPEAAGDDGRPRLAIYSHVDTETRARAEAAGFDLVVPRSRFVREGAALVEKLAR